MSSGRAGRRLERGLAEMLEVDDRELTHALQDVGFSGLPWGVAAALFVLV
jgi:hypothetical protein